MKKNPHAVALGRLGGNAAAESMTEEQKQARARKGGKKRKAGLTAEERTEIARKAAAARWRKKRD